MATYKRNETIKTADFIKLFGDLEEDIKETKYITKTAILRLLEDFKGKVVTYEPREEIEIYKFMEVR